MREINISTTLTAKRKEKGITQDELAAYIGVTKASVSKWETGLSYPDITLLPRLAAYFNISVDELLGYLPQMTREDIRKTTNRLISRFGSRPFEEALEECRQIIKKYYSCFPLLLQMSLVLLNHFMLAPTVEGQQSILKEIIGLCQRIKQEEEDVWITRQANSVEALCYVTLGQPQPVFSLLDGAMKPLSSDQNTLAAAYHLAGNPQKAAMVIQVAIYQRLIELSDFTSSYLMMLADKPARFEEALERFTVLNRVFRLDSLSPNASAKLYIAAAQGYASMDPQKALEMLEQYARVCKSMLPFEIKGDAFFDQVDEWMSEQDINTHAPRDTRLIKNSMLQIVEQNPIFASLADNPRFRSIIDQLKNL